MHPKRTSLAFVAFALSFHAGSAGAQTFAELAAGAREVDHELGSLAAPLLTSCEALVGRSRELCDANRGRAAAELGGEPLLVSMPAGDRVEVGPYEPRQGGFRVTVPAFEVSGRDGVVAVRRADARARRADPRARRASPLAEAFVRVPAEEAPAWAARNSTERLRLRLVFRFGDARVDRSRTGPAAPRVVEAGVIAAQLFNASTGNVLLDSTSATGALPRAPEPLDRRRALFSAQLEREVLFRAPNGRSALFHVRIERAEGAVGITPIVLLTHGAETVELVRFVAV
ncbi:MAG: hypothetical protein H5U40_05430, partial [Polyangiaceae bacterium]|nr:hypothetical protein [Polyangiaceae bacterium]